MVNAPQRGGTMFSKLAKLWNRRRPRGVDAVVGWVDGGDLFRWHEPAIRRAFEPRTVAFVRNAWRPDLVVGSLFGRSYRRVARRVPRVLFVGEPVEQPARAGDFDLVVSTVRSSGSLYVPFYVSSFGERRRHTPADLVKRPELVARALAGKSKFCAFLYRKPAAMREELYDVVSSIAPVDALGRARNSSEGRGDRDVYTADLTYHDLAVDAYQPYRFVICGENTRAPGYITEKIVNAMLAYAIPIYVGATEIEEHFNPRSFLNANRLSHAELVAEIRRLSGDPDAYAAMLAEPWFPENRLPEIFSDDHELTERIRALLPP
jgi:hypothetical protein